jgi:lysozyme
MAIKTAHKVVAGGTAAVIVATVGFLPGWEGTDHVAKRDMIGTGHPLTWCHGQTPADDPTVKPGQRFTDAQCDAALAKSLPKYLDKTGPCVHRPVPIKVMASLLDAAYNAGPAAVCKSPMVAKINAGDIRGGCDAFRGWYVRSAGQVRKGLIARRSGIGDGRKSERDLCLEGANDSRSDLYFHSTQKVVTLAPPAQPPAPVKKSWWSWIWKS